MILKLIATIIILIGSPIESYKLSSVKRVDKDLYRSGNIYIETKYCYRYTYGEDAILKWDGFSGKIIWDDNSTCDVKDVWRK
jgi:hypothetical protein